MSDPDYLEHYEAAREVADEDLKRSRTVKPQPKKTLTETPEDDMIIETKRMGA